MAVGWAWLISASRLRRAVPGTYRDVVQCPVCGGGDIEVYPQANGTFLCMCKCGAVWTK